VYNGIEMDLRRNRDPRALREKKESPASRARGRSAEAMVRA